MKKLSFLLFIFLIAPIFASAQFEGFIQSKIGSAVTSDKDIKQLLQAVKSNNLQEVKAIVEDVTFPSMLVNAADSNGNTPLMEAAKTGNTAIIKYLNNKKAKVNTLNNKGNSALGYAIANKRQKAAELLMRLNAKTDVNFKEDNSVKQKILVLAVKKKMFTIADKILANTDKKELLTTYSTIENPLLLTAIASGDVWFTSKLLDAGMDINNFYGAPYYATPFLYAAYLNNNKDMLEMMIRRPELTPETVKQFIFEAINSCAKPDLNTVQFVLKHFFIEHHIAEFNKVIYNLNNTPHNVTPADYAQNQVKNGHIQCKPLSDYLAYISNSK